MMGGTHSRRNTGRSVRAALCLIIVAAFVGAVLPAPGGAAAAPEPGVTDKTITLGFIYTATGVAASISKTGLQGFQARIGRQNASGGVNGRKIKIIARDDQSSPQNLTAAQDLVQNQHVFAIVNESPFAFLTFRWLEENNVPMIGNGADGTYYQEKGNEDILSSAGNSLPFGDLTYDAAARVMKMAGATKAAVLAYGAASSSVSTAKAFMSYAVPALGLDPAYTNTTVDFGSSDVGPLVLGIQKAGADGVYLPMAAATNVAVAQGLQQSGVNMKAVILATGYGQEFLDSPPAKSLPASSFFTVPDTPVEAKTAATKRFQADLKKYSHFAGVPDFGMYTGYILADFAIAGLQKAGNPPTRRGLIDGTHSLGMYDQAGLACQPVDVSLAGRGKTPKEGCGYVVQLESGKFAPFPKNGKPIRTKLVGSSDALAAAASGAAVTTTTAAPSP
jgi:ABC-type branched-subunit amino acid transport system substrate-binding protein